MVVTQAIHDFSGLGHGGRLPENPAAEIAASLEQSCLSAILVNPDSA
jgi:hypothetical protein